MPDEETRPAQVVIAGPLNPLTFAEQFNGELRRLARAGHTVTDIGFVAEPSVYSALVLYRPAAGK